MSSLMTNIRKISLQEGSSAIGRLLLQLGQAADSTLDAETLAELDKQAAVAACRALDAADGQGDGDGKEAGGEAPTGPEDNNPEEEAPAPDREASADANGAAKEDGGVHEEDSTATTVELSADGDFGSNTSSSHHLQQPPPQASGGGDPTPNATASSSSLMHASSSIHSTTSSNNTAAASPSTSSPRYHGAPSPRPLSARSSREASLVLPGGILSAAGAAATQPKDQEPEPEPAGGTHSSAVKPAGGGDGPVTVVLQGFDAEEDEKVVVCASKALAHLFTRIRNRDTPPHVFRFYASRMMRILAEEGIACLESSRQFITTPTAATFSSVYVDESNVCVVSILRAGDALAEAAQACIPTAPVGKILIQRDEESRDKRPVLFYKKLPPKIATMQVLLCDPMLATGGSALMAIRCLLEAGVKESAVVFVTVVVCPEGIGAVRAEFPEVTIVTGAIDDCLDERRYILPGLGDFGDRFFGTVP
eukprot:g13466.t1